jgi:deoxyribose-phosphate aldolase
MKHTPTYEEIAGMIDHSLLHPTLTDDELKAGCELAAKYRVASVCIKPYAVKEAARLLRGTGVAVGAVVGFPHGGSASEVKRFETEVACRDGATEIDMVINIGKALSGDWQYVEADVRTVVDEAHARGAIVKVIFENDFLPDDAHKVKLCEVCERAGADFVKTSTGYGMRSHCSPRVAVKAAGGVRDLDALIRVRELGATRCGATATAAMLDELRKRAAGGGQARVAPAGPGKQTTLGTGGY